MSASVGAGPRTRLWGTGAARKVYCIEVDSLCQRPKNASAAVERLLTAGHAEEAIPLFDDIPDPEMGDRYLVELSDDLSDDEIPREVRSLAWTLAR